MKTWVRLSLQIVARKAWVLLGGMIAVWVAMVVLPLTKHSFPVSSNSWMHGYHDHVGGLPYLEVVGAIVLMVGIGLAWAVMRVAKTWHAAVLFVLMSVVLQWGLQLAKADGPARNATRFAKTFGHAEFAAYAVSDAGLGDTLLRYDEQVGKDGPLKEYGRSKPPGTVLVYQVHAALSRVLSSISPGAGGPAKRSAAWAVWTWPLWAVLGMLPLLAIGRRWVSEEAARLACLLVLTTPSFNLVLLHLDQMLFPLVTLTAVWGTLALTFDGHRRAGLLGAAALVAALSLSFGMLTVALFCGVVGALAWVRAWRRGDDVGRTRAVWGMALPPVALAVTLGGWALLGYDYIEGYRVASAWHAEWKHWNPATDGRVAWARRNSIEFLWWMGPVAAVGLLAGVGRWAAQVRAGKHDPRQLLLAAFLTAFLAVALFSKTKSEVARLWIFLLPFGCLAAADVLMAWVVHPLQTDVNEEAVVRRRGTLVAMAVAGAQITVTLVYLASYFV